MKSKDELTGALNYIMGKGEDEEAKHSGKSESLKVGSKHELNEFLDTLPKKTTVIGFRVKVDERDRLREYFRQRFGTGLSQGLKRAVYDYLEYDRKKNGI